MKACKLSQTPIEIRISSPFPHRGNEGRMLKLFYKLIAGLKKPSPQEDWQRDPLLHPDLRRMTARELADLPFDPAPRDVTR